MKTWIDNKNDIHNSISKNFGQKDNTRYNRWRRIIHKKFDHKCAICGTKDIKLHAHHVVSWSDNVELRYNVENALLVCELCHSIIHGYSIGCGTKILHDEKRIKEVRKKYIEITKIKYMKQGNL
jgi:5-methylcytosine-specific restriction endonuclease McrA